MASSPEQNKATYSIKAQAGPSAILKRIDQIQKLIAEVPKEYLSDVQVAVDRIFQGRFEEEESSAEEEIDIEPPTKKRRSKKRNEMEELKAIQVWLRDKVPVEAVLPSETIYYNQTGEFKDYTAANTVSVDGFLYEEDDIDELCDTGKISRNFCLDCGSRRLQPLNFISHSFSIPELQFIFKEVLPKVCKGGLQDKRLVDIGSRFGGVVYGAVLLGGCSHAMGIEMNEDLCRLQEQTLSTFDLADRVQIVCGDIARQAGALKEADVVVMHNTFQFFQPPARAAEAWPLIREAMRPGTVMVCSPSLEDQLAASLDSSPALSESGKAAARRGGTGGGGAAGKGVKGGKAGKAGWEGLEWVERIAVTYPVAQDADDEHADSDGRLYTCLHFYRTTARAKDGK